MGMEKPWASPTSGSSGNSSEVMPRMVNWETPPVICTRHRSSASMVTSSLSMRRMISEKTLAGMMISPVFSTLASTMAVMPISRL